MVSSVDAINKEHIKGSTGINFAGIFPGDAFFKEESVLTGSFLFSETGAFAKSRMKIANSRPKTAYSKKCALFLITTSGIEKV